MNDKQFRKLKALHSETSRSAWLGLFGHAMTWMGMAYVLLNVGEPLLGTVFGVGGLGYAIIVMLKIYSKDGSTWARSIASLLPYWEDPIPRDVDTMKEVRDEMAGEN